jgi:effector-binding domain-containing protein
MVAAAQGQDVADRPVFSPPTDFETVTLKRVPEFQAIEAEVTGPVNEDWGKGFRATAKYAVTAEHPLRWPTIVVYPDWATKPPAAEARMLVQMPLDGGKELPEPRAKGLKLVRVNGGTVASAGFRGAYTLENFKDALRRIRYYLRDEKLAAVGPPRVLYHSDPDWTPLTSMLIGEVQVPVSTPESR